MRFSKYLIVGLFFFGVFLFLPISKADASISVTATSTIADQSNTNNWTWSHTNSGNLIAVTIDWWDNSGTVTLNSVTYGGQSLTLGKHTDQPSYVYNADVWYKASNTLPTGANNVVVTFSANSYGKAGAISLSGVDTSNPVDTTASTSNTAQGVVTHIIKNYSGSYLVDAYAIDTNSFSISSLSNYPASRIFSKNFTFGSSWSATSTLDTYIGWSVHDSGKQAHSVVAFKEAPAASIVVTFPDNAETTADFQNFNIDWTNEIPGYSTDWAFIYYGTSSSTYDFVDNDYIGSIETSSSTQIYKTSYLQPNTRYWQYAELYTGQGIVASSTPAYFDITDELFINNLWTAQPTSTSTPVSITCDPEDPFFEYSFCKLFTYLFIPPSDTFTRFGNLKTAIENKPPIGYFTAYKQAIENLTTSATGTIGFANLSSLGPGYFDYVKTYLGYALWFMLSISIYNRIRKLEL